jgi:hypothetical protein
MRKRRFRGGVSAAVVVAVLARAVALAVARNWRRVMADMAELPVVLVR